MAKKPFSHAGIIRFKGQLMTYVPDEGPCYRCVFKDPPPKDAVPTCKQAGVIGAMGGVIGSLQAMEAIKYLIGVGDLLTGRLLTFDALKMEFHTVKLPHKKGCGCAVCGPIQPSPSSSTTSRWSVTESNFHKEDPLAGDSLRSTQTPCEAPFMRLLHII